MNITLSEPVIPLRNWHFRFEKNDKRYINFIEFRYIFKTRNANKFEHTNAIFPDKKFISLQKKLCPKLNKAYKYFCYWENWLEGEWANGRMGELAKGRID